MTEHVLHPLEPPYPEAVTRLFERYPKDRNGYILRLFRVFANSLRFLGGKGVVNLLDRDSPLPLKEREIVILRVTANLGCEYEWGVHVTAFARAAGLDSTQVSATRTGSSDEPCWTERESCLLQSVDELCRLAVISDDTYGAFQAHFTVEQQLEVMALVGNYHLVSFVANTTRLPLEATGTRFPERRDSGTQVEPTRVGPAVDGEPVAH